MRCLEAPVLTVGKERAAVERRLAQGRLACPGCGQRLGPWGYARARVLREQGVARWRQGWDSNPWKPCDFNGFRVRRPASAVVRPGPGTSGPSCRNGLRPELDFRRRPQASGIGW